MNAQQHVVIEESPRLTPGEATACGGDARMVAAEFLARSCPWADADAVLLVVSELVANAVRHTAAGWWRLGLTAGPEALVVSVDDCSPLPPVAREPDLSGGGGFGWHMVRSLAHAVEVRPGPCGKSVLASWVRPASVAR
ncbi:MULTISPECIES: ATP-binding protein [unclassified Streptomyces]|uniref:ATP-binding protein n=1 Tax=unclassified Streptomyces TaxID=2593676 RepID=UPI00340EB51C